jgi:transcriptional regulator with XRE-family HTH domain
MDSYSDDSSAVVDRLLSAYGISTQKELAQILDISPNNISGWRERRSVPGYTIIKCVLDTGVDLEWLLNGKLSDANLNDRDSNAEKGQQLYDLLFKSGGKAALRRIMDAHGFTLQKEIGEFY